MHNLKQRTFTGGGGSIIVKLVSSLPRLERTKKENMLLFVCGEADESKFVKLETSHTVITPRTVSFLCLKNNCSLASLCQ